MSRLNQILIALLVVQIALVAYVFWPRPTAQAEGGPLVSGFNAAEVVSLTISDGDGHRVALAKSGDGWVLPEAGDFPVKADSVTPFLDKIGALKTNRLVTQTESSHRRLQVAPDEFNRLVEISLADGSSHKLFIGSSAGAGATHVRADDQPQVYLTADLTGWDANAQASAWIDTLYFTLPQTATVALTLENQNGRFEFDKTGDSWSMAGLAAGETLKSDEVTRLVNLASTVRLAEPIGRTEQTDFGLAEPLAVVTLKTADSDYTLHVGTKNSDTNNYVIKASNSPYYVWVAETTVNDFVTRSRADFVEQAPASTPTESQSTE
jgi:hypothetical protein